MGRRKSHSDLLGASPSKRRCQVPVCRRCCLLIMCCLMGATFFWQLWVHWTLDNDSWHLDKPGKEADQNSTWEAAAFALSRFQLRTKESDNPSEPDGSNSTQDKKQDQSSPSGALFEESNSDRVLRREAESEQSRQTEEVNSETQADDSEFAPCKESVTTLPSKTKGYLVVNANGGLNQMRLGIADMVAIAKVLEATLVVPNLDTKSYWRDNSTFEELFDLPFFIEALREDVSIVSSLPKDLQEEPVARKHFKTWSDLEYYVTDIAPLWQEYKIIDVAKTDNTLANNGLPLALQRLRCKVAFHALRFAPHIRSLAEDMIQELKSRGPFVALHLRYEQDMLAFSGCTHGLTLAEIDNLTAVRLATKQWRVKDIDPNEARRFGRCPLSPSEVGLILSALGFGNDTRLYIASGEIYGGQSRLAGLRERFPNLVSKESLASAGQLSQFDSRKNQLAALDYLISGASDVFVATYAGNMARATQGHRRLTNHRRSLILSTMELVSFLDAFAANEMDFESFSKHVLEVQGSEDAQSEWRVQRSEGTLGNSRHEEKEREENFYANPTPECLCDAASSLR